jgi:hypothetical protein
MSKILFREIQRLLLTIQKATKVEFSKARFKISRHAGLPDGNFLYQKIDSWYTLEGLIVKMLVYFTVIWYFKAVW